MQYGYLTAFLNIAGKSGSAQKGVILISARKVFLSGGVEIETVQISRVVNEK
jgi:hypothetical protein